ncbi:ribonuclease Z [Methanofollis fontis]|uniref:ribonuclease Z n=1 Tax=Methanofollis fontis TaxID=2052832 RepID=UPI0013EEABEF|nr:ribonuclease Z [Methanofollis fontis]
MAGETLQVYFLGTAGALPTPNRNPSCVMIRRGSDTLLFDCGEGAQQQMMRARTGFLVDAIFITHWHADHFLGVLGLVQTLSFNGRTDPLTVYGPEGIVEFVEHTLAIGKTKLGFDLRPVLLSPGSIVRFDGYQVEAFATCHGMVSLGYVLREDGRPGRFDRETAITLGVPPGPLFGRLQRGGDVVVVRDGAEVTITPDQVLGPPRPGRMVVYSGDTRPLHHGPEEGLTGADLLIHDATFDDTERGRAAEVFHSTAGEAGEAAAALKARQLALVHMSSRYTSTVNHIQDAGKSFDGEVIAPSDLMMIEIPFRE